MSNVSPQNGATIIARAFRSLIIPVAACFNLISCNSGGSERLELTANALSKSADECLLDVRDRGLKYETSSHCTSLKTLSMQHTEAGGFRSETPAKYALIAAEARATAWAARAVSASGNPAINIW
jgi:hypothetical protein